MSINSPAGHGRGGLPEGVPGKFGPLKKEGPIASPPGDGRPGGLPGKPSLDKKGPIASPSDSWKGQIPSKDQPDEPFRAPGE